jgi:hypothetical protein
MVHISYQLVLKLETRTFTHRNLTPDTFTHCGVTPSIAFLRLLSLSHQILYEPSAFGQYVCPADSEYPNRVNTVVDQSVIGATYWIYDDGESSQVFRCTVGVGVRGGGEEGEAEKETLRVCENEYVYYQRDASCLRGGTLFVVTYISSRRVHLITMHTHATHPQARPTKMLACTTIRT